MITALAWIWFGVVQIVSGVATILGWLALLPFCALRAWKTGPKSIKDGRVIDVWSCGLLNSIYGNPEDGVSGQTALIWIDGVLAPYMPQAGAFWRAYCWSALRNSCDNLKYVFAWQKGPFARWTLFGRPMHAGWQMENGFNVPVISL